MLSYIVEDMTCGHCAGTITKALRTLDPGAEVTVDLGRHEVKVNGRTAAADIEAAIRDAGYTPQALSPEAPAAAARAGGCCCGGAASRCHA